MHKIKAVKRIKVSEIKVSKIKVSKIKVSDLFIFLLPTAFDVAGSFCLF